MYSLSLLLSDDEESAKKSAEPDVWLVTTATFQPNGEINSIHHQMSI